MKINPHHFSRKETFQREGIFGYISLQKSGGGKPQK